MPKSVSIRWILLFGAPIFLILLIAYVHLRTLNRSLESRLYAIEDEHQVFSGEVYRLRQVVDERDAKIKFLRDTEMKRFLVETEGGFFWFFRRNKDNVWFVDAENSPNLNPDQNFRLLIKGKEIGSFRARAAVVGLQKIGASEELLPFEILVAPADQDWRENSELIYSAPDGFSAD